MLCFCFVFVCLVFSETVYWDASSLFAFRLFASVAGKDLKRKTKEPAPSHPGSFFCEGDRCPSGRGGI